MFLKKLLRHKNGKNHLYDVWLALTLWHALELDTLFKGWRSALRA